MLSFEDMVLPKGMDLENFIKESRKEIAKIGASNAPFSFVRIRGKRFVEANPEVRDAWEMRQAHADDDAG
jgi:hypothetical protein